MEVSAIHRLKTRGITIKARQKGRKAALESYRMMFIDTSDYGWEEVKEKLRRTSIQLYPKENITSI